MKRTTYILIAVLLACCARGQGNALSFASRPYNAWPHIQTWGGGVLTTSVYVRGPSMAAEGDAAFIGGVLLPSGKVVLVPCYADYVGLFEPTPLITVHPKVAESPYLNKF